MAYKFQRKSGRWTGMYVDADGQARSAGTYNDEDQALAVAQAMEAFIERGRIGTDPVTKATITIAKYGPQWLRSHVVEPNTKANYDSILRNHIYPAFGTKRVAELERQDVRTYLTDLDEAGASVTLQKRVRAVLSAMMQTAWDDSYRSDNPVRGLRVRRGKRRQIVVLTTDQFQSVYKQLPSRGAKLLARLIVNSGLRFGEATELRVSDLDLDSSQVMVRRAVQDCGTEFNPHGKLRFYTSDYTKTGVDRTLSLNKPTMKALTDWIADMGIGPTDLIFPRHLVITESGRTRPRLDRPELTPEYIATLGTVVSPKNGRTYQHGTPNGYVLGGCREECCRHAINTYKKERNRTNAVARGNARVPNSQPYLGRDRWGDVWKRACSKAGLSFAPTAYQLRHTHASWLINQGVDALKVMERLGHTDLSTTSLYVHKVEDDRSAADAMDDLDLDLDD